jgi:hypothetical protein
MISLMMTIVDASMTVSSDLTHRQEGPYSLSGRHLGQNKEMVSISLMAHDADDSCHSRCLSEAPPR